MAITVRQKLERDWDKLMPQNRAEYIARCGASEGNPRNLDTLERACERNTVYRLRNRPAWIIEPRPWSPAARKWLLDFYGDEVAEVLNETLLLAGAAKLTGRSQSD
jgi:hypothetical protein